MPKVYLDTGVKKESIRYDSIEISGKFMQVYDDLHETLFQISSACAIHLLFWMAQKMGTYNQVSMNKNNRSDFISDSYTHNGKKYSHDTVKSALRVLTKHKLIVSMSEKGKREALYFVNPFHFWKTGSQKDRTESIKGFLYKLNENETN